MSERLTFEQYRQAIPDLTWNELQWEGTCLVCGRHTIIGHVFTATDFELFCTRCKRERLDAAVRAALNGHEPTVTPEPGGAGFKAVAPQAGKLGPKVEGWNAVELAAMNIPPAKYAVPGYICEGLNVLAGGQKFGKSWLMMGLGISIASGGVALGQIAVEQGEVLAIFLEDTPRRLQSRLLDVLGDEPAPRDFYIYDQWPSADAGGLALIEKWLEKHQRTRMVIIDVMAKFRGSRPPGGDIYQQDYAFGGRIKRVGDEHSVAMLMSHHISKRQCDDPFDAVSGTIAVTGSADATLLLRRQRGKNEAQLFVTGRDVEEREMGLLWSPETYQWTLDGTAKDQAMSKERREIIAVLQLRGAMGPKEIADTLQKNRSTIRRLLQGMVTDGEVRWESGLYMAPLPPS
jgi:hypothetical protein